MVLPTKIEKGRALSPAFLVVLSQILITLQHAERLNS